MKKRFIILSTMIMLMVTGCGASSYNSGQSVSSMDVGNTKEIQETNGTSETTGSAETKETTENEIKYNSLDELFLSLNSSDISISNIEQLCDQYGLTYAVANNIVLDSTEMNYVVSTIAIPDDYIFGHYYELDADCIEIETDTDGIHWVAYYLAGDNCISELDAPTKAIHKFNGHEYSTDISEPDAEFFTDQSRGDPATYTSAEDCLNALLRNRKASDS